MTHDVNLFYTGGSGGFFCLHLLLLTGQYQCIFEGEEQDFEQIFQKQWNIGPNLWKSSETKLNNPATAVSSFSNKIYRVCGNVGEWQKYSGIKVVLYTDIETQWFLAKTKNANWFVNETNMIQQLDTEFAIVYNNIKGSDWPECSSISNFNKLPNFIKDECLNLFQFEKYWDFNAADPILSLLIARSAKYNNNNVHYKLVEKCIFDQADIVVKLQDLIKTNGEILFSQLGITSNDRCTEFIQYWLSLHSKEQLSHLLK
jgi:hypothetical protein